MSAVTREAAISAADPWSVLETATSDLQAGKYPSARSAYMSLRDAGECGPWPSFFLGRIHLQEGQPQAAKSCFDEALSLDPSFFWACYERLTLSLAEAGTAVDSLDLIKRLLSIDWMSLDLPHILNLERVAHQLWDCEERQTGTRVLEKLWPADELAEFSLLRLVEGSRQAQLRAAAARRLRAMETLSSTALRVLAEYFRESQANEDERCILEQHRRQAPKDFSLFLSLARAYARDGETDKLAQLVAAGQAFPPRERNFVTLAIAIEQSALATACDVFHDHVRLYRDAPKGLGIRLGYLASASNDIERRDWIASVLQAFHPDDQDVALLAINAAIRDQNWAWASELFARRFGDGEGHPATVRHAQIEILAYGGRPAQAIDLLRAQAVGGVYPTAIVRTALRVLARAGLWSEALEAGLSSVDKDSSFDHFFAPMIQAARKVKASRTLYEALIALPKPLTGARLSALEAVAGDLAEEGRSGDGDDALEAVTAKGRLPQGRMRSRGEAAAAP
jgi:tetratricopeptide (TPR) repeat protein